MKITRYLVNSLTVMLEAQEKLDNCSLVPCHRIDRETSGLVLLAEDKKVAKFLTQAIQEGSCQKTYLARVEGNFRNVDAISSCHPDEDGIVHVDKAIVTVDPIEGIRAVAHLSRSTSAASMDNNQDEKYSQLRVRNNGKKAIHQIDLDGNKVLERPKEALSKFKILSYDEKSNTSLLVCSPVSGRTHQLRVHLKYLGFPIINDTKYGATASNIDAQNENNPMSIKNNTASAVKLH